MSDTALEQQFELPSWNFDWKANRGQKVYGKEFVVLSPTRKVEALPNVIEFDLKAEEVLSMSPNTRFRIRGQFQTKVKD